MVAGARGVKEADVMVDPTSKSAVGLRVGVELAAASTQGIINLIPEHQMFYKLPYDKHRSFILLAYLLSFFLRKIIGNAHSLTERLLNNA